jgi:hypothetical protein
MAPPLANGPIPESADCTIILVRHLSPTYGVGVIEFACEQKLPGKIPKNILPQVSYRQ